MARITLTEEGRVQVIPLGSEPAVVGRAQDNAIVIQDKKSSRRHCRFVHENGRFFLEDLNSSNGTLVNGSPVTRILLTGGERVQIGDAVMEFQAAAEGTDARVPAASPAASLAVPAGAGAQPASQPSTTRPAAEARQEEAGMLEEPETEIAGEAREPTPSLVIEDGPQAGFRAKLEELPFTIGRKSANSLSLNDSRVSGTHCQIVREGIRWYVEDLDSGNGVFLDGKKVKRQQLRGGDTLVIGNTKIRFEGVAAPRIPGGANPGTVIRAADSFGISEEDISRLASPDRVSQESPLQAVWTGVFVLSLLGILYFGYDLISKQVNQNRVPFDAANQLENPSFETVLADGRVPGWEIDPEGDSAELESLVNPQVPHGTRALRVRTKGEGKRGFTRLIESEAKPLLERHGFEVRGRIFNEGFRVAGLEVIWLLTTADEERIVGESFIRPSKPGTSYTPVKRVVFPPALFGATHCRLAVLGYGEGSLLVDDLALTSAGEEDGSAPENISLTGNPNEEHPLAVSLAPDGTFCIRRGAETPVTQVRFVTPDGGGFPYGQLLALSSNPPQKRDNGIVVSSMGFPGVGREVTTCEQVLQSLGETLRATWQVRAPGTVNEGDPHGLVLEFDRRMAKGSFALYHHGTLVVDGKEIAVLNDHEGDELVLGQQSQQVILRFNPPLTCRVLPDEATRRVPTLLLSATLKAPNRLLELSLSALSTHDERRIQRMLEEMRQFLEQKQYSKVLAHIATLRREYPWRDDLRDRLAADQREIAAIARDRLEELRAMQAELARYSASPVRAVLERLCMDLMSSFEGDETARKVAEILEESRQAVRVRQEQSAEKSSGEILAVGLNHLEQKRNYLARIYLDWVKRDYPGTANAEAAEVGLKRLDARK